MVFWPSIRKDEFFKIATDGTAEVAGIGVDGIVNGLGEKFGAGCIWMKEVVGEVLFWAIFNSFVPVCDNDVGVFGGCFFEEFVIALWVAVGGAAVIVGDENNKAIAADDGNCAINIVLSHIFSQIIRDFFISLLN